MISNKKVLERFIKDTAKQAEQLLKASESLRESADKMRKSMVARDKGTE
jgi:hypothetical protein